MNAKSPLIFCLVTWATHNSRVSERMVTYLPPDFIKGMKGLILDVEKQLLTTQAIAEGITKYDLPTLTYNVLPDHVHMIAAIRTEEELAMKIGNIKGYASHILRKKCGIKSKVWAQKFHRSWLNDQSHFDRAAPYVTNNHLKHESSWGEHFLCGYTKEFEAIRSCACTSLEEILMDQK